MSEKEKDTEGGASQEHELKPEDFIRKPSTERLKKKAEGWQNDFLVHGARQKQCKCECRQQD
ncbi:hypothetical protein MYX06_02155 [Patescibacteria group bacterium AH-259-L05]|nr:hypothetical protein [Patescibacteria group bacterium AH-259-L05]